MRKYLAVLIAVVLVMGAFTAQAQSTYTVELNDVLDLIALEFDVSVSCLAEANDLDNPGLIYPGDELIIPSDCPPYDGLSFIPGADPGRGGGALPGEDERTTCFGDPVRVRTFSGSTYTVQQGDILDFIGCDLGFATDCLAEANDLETPGFLEIGQELTIPASCPIWRDAFGQPATPVETTETTEEDEDLGSGGGATDTDEDEDDADTEDATDDEDEDTDAEGDTDETDAAG